MKNYVRKVRNIVVSLIFIVLLAICIVAIVRPTIGGILVVALFFFTLSILMVVLISIEVKHFKD